MKRIIQALEHSLSGLVFTKAMQERVLAIVRERASRPLIRRILHALRFPRDGE